MAQRARSPRSEAKPTEKPRKSHHRFAASYAYLRAEDMHALKRECLPFPGKQRSMGWDKCCFFQLPIAAQAKWPLGVHSFPAAARFSLVFPKSTFPHED
jgi:hypothetical protein